MKKETLQYRLDNKLCTRCGEPVVPNRKMCSKHLKESRLKTRRKTAHWKSQNICTRCGQRPPRSGKTQCSVCVNGNKDQYNAAKMDIYYQRRSAGVCVRCGEPTNNFEVHCDTCTTYMRQKDRTRYNKSKESGLCLHCHKVPHVEGEILCLDCKQKNAVRNKDKRIKQKFTIIQHYGGKCQMCGETDMDVLGIDHIYGSGTRHRKELTQKGTTFYRWIVKNNYPTGFQVLCFNCNFKKHLSDGVCPHKQRTIKTRYTYEGQGEPAKFVLDDP